MYRVAIFDLNGTILEDEPLWGEALDKVYADRHGSQTFEHVSGVGLHDNWKKLQESDPSFKKHSLDILVEDTKKQYFIRLQGMRSYRAGFLEFARFLISKEIPLILATSSSSDIVEKTFEYFPELSSLFDQVVTGDKVAMRKPAPDIFLLAQPEGFSSEDCVVFEDSVAGVMAAQAAGMHCVYLPNGLEELPKDIQPDLTVHDFTDTKVLELF